MIRLAEIITREHPEDVNGKGAELATYLLIKRTLPQLLQHEELAPFIEQYEDFLGRAKTVSLRPSLCPSSSRVSIDTLNSRDRSRRGSII
jgi:hypothetical protein